MGFMKFKQAIAKQFKSMLDLGCDLYVVDVNRDELWEKYLASFPEGTNPIHRTRTEHDCSACRHFIKTLGPVVAIASDIRLVSIWDTPYSRRRLFACCKRPQRFRQGPPNSQRISSPGV